MFQTQYRKCIPVSDEDNMSYTFYVDVGAGSAEGDIDFWVRLRVGPDRGVLLNFTCVIFEFKIHKKNGFFKDEDTEYLWCFDVEAEYPQSLMELPPYVTAPPVEPLPGSAPALYASLFLCFAMATLKLVL